jgi:hypothetical protein
MNSIANKPLIHQLCKGPKSQMQNWQLAREKSSFSQNTQKTSQADHRKLARSHLLRRPRGSATAYDSGDLLGQRCILSFCAVAAKRAPFGTAINLGTGVASVLFDLTTDSSPTLAIQHLVL